MDETSPEDSEYYTFESDKFGVWATFYDDKTFLYNFTQEHTKCGLRYDEITLWDEKDVKIKEELGHKLSRFVSRNYNKSISGKNYLTMLHNCLLFAKYDLRLNYHKVSGKFITLKIKSF